MVVATHNKMWWATMSAVGLAVGNAPASGSFWPPQHNRPFGSKLCCNNFCWQSCTYYSRHGQEATLDLCEPLTLYCVRNEWPKPSRQFRSTFVQTESYLSKRSHFATQAMVQTYVLSQALFVEATLDFLTGHGWDIMQGVKIMCVFFKLAGYSFALWCHSRTPWKVSC